MRFEVGEVGLDEPEVLFQLRYDPRRAGLGDGYFRLDDPRLGPDPVESPMHPKNWAELSRDDQVIVANNGDWRSATRWDDPDMTENARSAERLRLSGQFLDRSTIAGLRHLERIGLLPVGPYGALPVMWSLGAGEGRLGTQLTDFFVDAFLGSDASRELVTIANTPERADAKASFIQGRADEFATFANRVPPMFRNAKVFAIRNLLEQLDGRITDFGGRSENPRTQLLLDLYEWMPENSLLFTENWFDHEIVARSGRFSARLERRMNVFESEDHVGASMIRTMYNLFNQRGICAWQVHQSRPNRAERAHIQLNVVKRLQKRPDTTEKELEELLRYEKYLESHWKDPKNRPRVHLEGRNAALMPSHSKVSIAQFAVYKGEPPRPDLLRP